MLKIKTNVREFQMAEIEHFCEDDVVEKDHPKWEEISHIKMNLLPRELQVGGNEAIECTIGDAVKTRKWVSQTTLGYYMARTQLYLLKIGINPNKLRFRQHKEDEMAHYARDCWDAEIHTTYGWIECVGHADRACFDLNQHSNATGCKMQAEKIYDKPRDVTNIHKSINKKEIAKKYQKASKDLITYLQSLNDNDAIALDSKLNQSFGFYFVFYFYFFDVFLKIFFFF